jgi:quaternary ammonium compound-resistance protein SugE
MAWVYLVTAGILEIAWAYALKQSHGFTRLLPAAISIIAMIASIGLLSLAMRTLPLGTAYTIWTGMGAVGAFLLGILVLGEIASPMRFAAAGLIVAGLIAMKLSASA